MAFFASDNTASVSPEIMRALQQGNTGHARAYGADEYTQMLTQRFREVFHHPDLLVFPVFSGSAANSTALASLIKPYEAAICHEFSHIQQDECGMPELFSGGKLLCVAGDRGKIDVGQVAGIVGMAKGNGVHHVRPKAISITQSTEAGSVYSIQEIKKIAVLAREYGLYLHIDGARFANAVASLHCAPADITWKAGVDVLSFGGTKNGAMLAEAVVFFNPALAKDFDYIRKRSGQLASKQRYISVQLLALLENDLWLRNAAHSNAMAQFLQRELEKMDDVEILFPAEANTVFARIPKAIAGMLLAKHHAFYDWPLFGDDAYRLVTSCETSREEIGLFIKDFTACYATME